MSYFAKLQNIVSKSTKPGCLKYAWRNMRNCSSTAPARYPYNMRIIHWTMASGVLASFGLVELAKRTDKKNPLKWELMKYHKTIGLFLAALITVRIGVRLTSKLPALIPGPSFIQWGGNLSHLALYSFMIFMPVSGIAMGYFGGGGLPFFEYKIPGKKEPNKTIAGAAYKYHKKAGTLFEILVGLHLCAVGYHLAQGNAILARMTLFSGSMGGLLCAVDDDEGYEQFNMDPIVEESEVKSVDEVE